MEVTFNMDLAGRNTFGMKVSCACFVEYDSVAELEEFFSRRDDFPKPILHIGGGSNLLFTKDFPGTLLHSRIRFLDFSRPDQDGIVYAEAGAGVSWDDFCKEVSDRGLWGPENLSGIPGEVGAAAVQHIGAYGVEVGEIISEVNCFHPETGRRRTFKTEECRYAYRSSIFKQELKGSYIVLSVRFSLSTVPRPRLKYGQVRARVESALAGDGLAPSSVHSSTKDGPARRCTENGHTPSPARRCTENGTTPLPARGCAEGTLASSSVHSCTKDGPARRCTENGTTPSSAHSRTENGLTPSLIRRCVMEIRDSRLPDPAVTGSAGSFFKNPIVTFEDFERILRSASPSPSLSASPSSSPSSSPHSAASPVSSSVSSTSSFSSSSSSLPHAPSPPSLAPFTVPSTVPSTSPSTSSSISPSIAPSTRCASLSQSFLSAGDAERISTVASGKYREVPHWVLDSGLVKLSAAWLIESCGWRGHAEGNVAVYDRQPLVLVNATGRARPQEILDLEAKIVQSVRNAYGIELAPEVEHI